MQFSELLSSVKSLCSLSGTAHDSFLKEQINFGQQDFSREINWKFLEFRGSLASVQYQYIYSLASDLDVLRSVTWKQFTVLKPVSWQYMKLLMKWSSYGKPRNYCEYMGKLYLYPQPNEAAATTTLNGEINSSVTTITLTSTTDLKPKGRIIIDSEVISYQYIDSTNKQLKICTRAEEGTTAASHLTLATVTYRNLEYDYYKTLSDLSADADVSSISTRYHESMIYYAASKWHEKLATAEDRSLANDYRTKYLLIRTQALKDLGEKQVQKFTSTLDDTLPDVEVRDETNPERGSLTKI